MTAAVVPTAAVTITLVSDFTKGFHDSGELRGRHLLPRPRRLVTAGIAWNAVRVAGQVSAYAVLGPPRSAVEVF